QGSARRGMHQGGWDSRRPDEFDHTRHDLNPFFHLSTGTAQFRDTLFRLEIAFPRKIFRPPLVVSRHSPPKRDSSRASSQPNLPPVTILVSGCGSLRQVCEIASPSHHEQKSCTCVIVPFLRVASKDMRG